MGRSQGILSLLPSLGWLLEMDFSGLAPTVPLCILCREVELAEDKKKGTDTARKPTWPSGTSSDLERECLTGVVGGTATHRGHTEEFYSSHFWYRQDQFPRGAGTSRHMTGGSQLSCFASPSCGLFCFSRTMESSSLLEAAFLKILAVEINPL